MTIREANAPVADAVIGIIRENDFKQKAIASRGGYTQQEFTDMLNGRRLIKIADVLRLANALGVSPSELFGRDEVQDAS